MLYLFGGVIFTSYFIYKYRSSVSYNLLRAFSYVEEYLPKQKQAINISNNGVYKINMNNYTLELSEENCEIPNNIDNLNSDLVYISNGKIYNSVINLKNSGEETKSISVDDIAAATITFSGDQEIEITELVGNLSVVEFGLNLNRDVLPIILVLFNEFYDGNLLIEEFIDKTAIFTIITNKGEIISLSSINLNITI